MKKLARSLAVVISTVSFIALGAGMANAEVISQSTSEEDAMIYTEEGTSHEDTAPTKIGKTPGVVSDKTTESSIPEPLGHLVRVPVVDPILGVVIGYDWVWVEAGAGVPPAIVFHP